MPIDDAKYNLPATQGQLAGLAIKMAIGLNEVSDAIQLLNGGNGDALRAKIKEIRARSDQLNQMFDDLVGWTSE